jgi:hypothetical protein
MSEKLIGFTDEEITFAVSALEYTKTKLQEQHDASHSGVDQLLINGWIISTSEMLTKFESMVSTPEPSVADKELLEVPEA